MNKVDRAWMLLGAITIAAISSLLITVGIMNPFVPMPLHMVILAWTLSYGFIVVMPLIYLVEFKILSNRKNFGYIVFITTLFFSVLDSLYFWGSWKYGIKYQGEMHTRVVAIENIIGFIALFVLAYLGISKKSKALQYVTNLLLFMLLSWCVFPYLGELP